MDGYIIPAGAQVPAPFPSSALSTRAAATVAASSTTAPLPRTPPRANTSRTAGQGASSRTPPGSTWAPTTPVSCGAAPSAAGTLRTPPSAHTCMCVPRPVNAPRRGATRKSTDRPPQGVRSNIRTTLPSNMGGTVQATTSVWPVPLRGAGRGATGPGGGVGSSRQAAGANYGGSGRAPGGNANVTGNVKALGVSATVSAPGLVSATVSASVPSLGSTNNILQSSGLNSSETLRTGHGFVEQTATPQCRAESLVTGAALDCTTNGADPSATCRSVKLMEADSAGYPHKNCEKRSKEQPPPSPLAPHNERAEPAAVVRERKLRPHLYQNYPTRGVYA